jgi:hypothetical protein
MILAPQSFIPTQAGPQAELALSLAPVMANTARVPAFAGMGGDFGIRR